MVSWTSHTGPGQKPRNPAPLELRDLVTRLDRVSSWCGMGARH